MKCVALVLVSAIIIAVESGCPGGKPQVYCFVDPCRFNNRCLAFPEAKCISDYCGGCLRKWRMPDGSYLSKLEAMFCDQMPPMS